MLSLTGLTLCTKLVQIRPHSFPVKHGMQSGIHSIRVTVRQPLNTVNDPPVLGDGWNFMKYILLANHIQLITNHSEKVGCPFNMQPHHLILQQHTLKQKTHQWHIHCAVLYLFLFNVLTTSWTVPKTLGNSCQT